MGRRPAPRGRPRPPQRRRQDGPILPLCEADQSCFNRSKVAFMGMTYEGAEEWSEPVTVMSCYDHASTFEARNPKMERRDLKPA